MKVSLNWLREFVELPPTVPALVDLLTLAGIEVEDVQTRGVDIPNVVVAQIKESVQHPNADRLSVCQVDDGTGAPRQIVCGAKNYQVGDKVPLALPGAKLPSDFTIKVGKLRGVESQGMMCSAKELNLAEDAEGLLILPPNARVGAPLGELFPGDTILDLEITPNRSDLLSHAGIAREIATLTGKKLTWPGWEEVEESGDKPVRVVLETDSPCYYSALLVSGTKIGASPEWLHRKLEAVGLRAINNAVDVTNYLMMLSGQPAHVFDAGKVDGTIRVRDARHGESLQALDGKTYELTPTDLVIADDQKVLALAGVIGGAESGVTDATKDVVLEIANFEPARIRRTSRRLGISSDSSYRFERGVDLVTSNMGSHFTGRLLAELCAATALSKKSTATNRGDEFKRFLNDEASVIPLQSTRVKALLGLNVPDERIDEILTGFGLAKTEGGWRAAYFRPDLTREVDLIEEIARVVGMDAIPARTQARFAAASATDRAYDRAMDLRRALAGLGLHEARSLTLVPAEDEGEADLQSAVPQQDGPPRSARPRRLQVCVTAFTQTAPGSLQRVKNPMIDDQVVLRPNLLPGLLEAVARNVRAGEKSIRLFEVGRVFSTIQPEEFSHLAFVLSGPVGQRSWRGGEGCEADLFDVKGFVAAMLGGATSFEPEENPALALSISIKVGGECVGLAGQLWPTDARALDAAAPVLFAELDLEALAKAQTKITAGKYREIPRFPATSRDIALLAPVALAHGQIASVLQAANEPLLANVELFDVFADPTGTKIPADQRSLAYSLTYRASDRTLTADEVNAAHSRLKQRLTTQLGVTLRE